MCERVWDKGFRCGEGRVWEALCEKMSMLQVAIQIIDVCLYCGYTLCQGPSSRAS